MNRYLELKKKHQEETNQFPMKFAFGKEQFNEMMKSWGLSADNLSDLGKIVGLGFGGYMLMKDVAKYKELCKRQKEEMQKAIDEDTTGYGFIYQMFRYELANHEFGYTYDYEDTLNDLGLTIEKINAKPNLKNGFEKAIKML